MNAKERIDLEKQKEQNQYVVLFIDETGKVTNIVNDWDTTDTANNPYDPAYPCEFTTPVNKGKAITWMGIKDPNCKQEITIQIEYVLMNNAKGKQILTKRNYNRGSGDVIVGKVKNRGVTNGEIEDYFIIYSVDEKAYLLDPMIEGHGF